MSRTRAVSSGVRHKWCCLLNRSLTRAFYEHLLERREMLLCIRTCRQGSHNLSTSTTDGFDGQVLYLWASAAARQTIDLLSNCPWESLVVGAVCPFLILLLGEMVKRHDARVYDRYVTLLRLEFDTRLGMHSPR